MKSLERARSSTKVCAGTDTILYIHCLLGNVLGRHGDTFKLFANNTRFYMSQNNVQRVEVKISDIMSDIGK